MSRAQQVTLLKVIAVFAGAAMIAGVVLIWVSVANPDSGAMGGAAIAMITAFLVVALLCTSVIERWRRQAKQN